MVQFHIALERESRAVRTIVDNAFGQFEDIGRVAIPRRHVTEASGEHGSDVEGYVRTSLDRSRGQVNIATYGDLLRRNVPQDELHFMLTILNTDLFGPGTNFVFGSTLGIIHHSGRQYGWAIDSAVSGVNFMPGSTLSLHRPQMWYGEKWQVAFSTLLVHELGHFYGLTAESNPNGLFGRQYGIEDGHCNDSACIMEQVNVAGRKSLLEKAESMSTSKLFCGPDEETLKRNLRGIY